MFARSLTFSPERGARTFTRSCRVLASPRAARGPRRSPRAGPLLSVEGKLPPRADMVKAQTLPPRSWEVAQGARAVTCARTSTHGGGTGSQGPPPRATDLEAR